MVFIFEMSNTKSVSVSEGIGMTAKHKVRTIVTANKRCSLLQIYPLAITKSFHSADHLSDSLTTVIEEN